MKTLPVGVQVYSVRDDAAKDFKGTMQKLKDMGYDGVELAGGAGNQHGVQAVLVQPGCNLFEMVHPSSSFLIIFKSLAFFRSPAGPVSTGPSQGRWGAYDKRA